MFSKVWYCFPILLCLMLSGCQTQRKTTHEPPVQTSVRTETVVVTPIVTGRAVVKSNVRGEASSGSSIVDVLAKGRQVEIIGRKGNWYQVRRTEGNAPAGFIYHKLITLDFGNYLGIRGRNKQQAVLYNSPSRADGSVMKIEPQTSFDILGFENGYYKVKGEYFEGFINADLCVADPSAPIAKTETVTIASKAGSTKTVSSGKKITAPARSRFRSGSSASTMQKSTVTKKSTSEPSMGAALFGAFASALLNGGGQNRAAQPQSDNDAIKDILKSVSVGKELAQKTVEIREQMLTALNETRALQSLVGATVSAMNNNYKVAVDTARGISSTGMKKISIKAFIQDLSYEPTESIESASVKIAQNGKMLRALETQIKSEAADFSNLNAQQLQNMDSIIGSFSNNLHASNALYDFSIDKSSNVILGIDRAINAYDEKAGPMAAEVTKQAGIIALATAELVSVISNAQNDPISALTALPRFIEIQDELTTLTSLFSDFQSDYEYIEDNSALINQQGKDISRIIMTARRKNTQVTTLLESYYQQKLELSKRLKDRMASQTASEYKAVEKKAASVALAEDMLD